MKYITITIRNVRVNDEWRTDRNFDRMLDAIHECVSDGPEDDSDGSGKFQLIIEADEDKTDTRYDGCPVCQV